MIRSYFGLTKNPFTNDNLSLLPHQQTIFDTFRLPDPRFFRRGSAIRSTACSIAGYSNLTPPVAARRLFVFPENDLALFAC